MVDLLTEMTLSVAEGLQSQSLTNCLRWAANRRIMAHEDFPGSYSAKYHPWVKEMHNSKAPFNYAMKGAQLGVTEVLINLAFYTIDMLKRDVLYVLPTSKNASDFSKSRFNPALKNSPYLKGIFTDTNAIELKQAGANTLYIRGSRGDSNLKSIPVSVLLLDEIDEMSQRAIHLALERLSGSLSKTVWGISTPTVPGYGIDKLFKKTTQEHFTFKCPCCSKWTELIWPDCVEIIGESIQDPRCHESFLKCTECGGKLEHKAKPEWLKKAKWHATNSNSNPDMRGFAISQLYSYTVTPGELAVAHFTGFGDEAANVEFYNSKIGIPYIGEGAKVNDEDLDACVANYTRDDPRPTCGDRVITMGIDQGKWNYAEVTEWFFDSYSVDLNVAAKAKVLFHHKFHEENFNQTVDELMREWQIQACVIDPDPHPMEARRFARRFPGYVWLCRFRRGVTGKEISVADEGDFAPIATVERSTWFSAALGRFREPRRILIPRDVSMEYREHIKAPVRTYVRVGGEKSTKDEQKKNQSADMVAAYISTGVDHFALARVYSEIALPFAASLSQGEDISKFL
jgi:phage terminase large subunit GpA-like protein